MLDLDFVAELVYRTHRPQLEALWRGLGFDPAELPPASAPLSTVQGALLDRCTTPHLEAALTLAVGKRAEQEGMLHLRSAPVFERPDFAGADLWRLPFRPHPAVLDPADVEAVMTRLCEAPSARHGVVIHGPPGSGKTELALAVARQARRDRLFERGVFWIDCDDWSKSDRYRPFPAFDSFPSPLSRLRAAWSRADNAPRAAPLGGEALFVLNNLPALDFELWHPDFCEPMRVLVTACTVDRTQTKLHPWAMRPLTGEQTRQFLLERGWPAVAAQASLVEWFRHTRTAAALVGGLSRDRRLFERTRLLEPVNSRTVAQGWVEEQAAAPSPETHRLLMEPLLTAAWTALPATVQRTLRVVACCGRAAWSDALASHLGLDAPTRDALYRQGFLEHVADARWRLRPEVRGWLAEKIGVADAEAFVRACTRWTAALREKVPVLEYQGDAMSLRLHATCGSRPDIKHVEALQSLCKQWSAFEATVATAVSGRNKPEPRDAKNSLHPWRPTVSYLFLTRSDLPTWELRGHPSGARDELSLLAALKPTGSPPLQTVLSVAGPHPDRAVRTEPLSYLATNATPLASHWTEGAAPEAAASPSWMYTRDPASPEAAAQALPQPDAVFYPTAKRPSPAATEPDDPRPWQLARMIRETIADEAAQRGARHWKVVKKIFGLGFILLDCGDYWSAREVWEECLGDEPNGFGPMAGHELAFLLVTLGDLEGARRAVETAAGLSALSQAQMAPRSTSVPYGMGFVLHGLGELWQARSIYEEALKGPIVRDRINFTAHCRGLYGLLLLDLGELEKAKEVLREAYQTEAGYRQNGDTATWLAIALHRGGEPEAALTLCEKVLKDSIGTNGDLHPLTAGVRTLLAIFLLAKGDTTQTTALLTAALSGHVRALGWRHPQVAICLYHLGRSLLAERKYGLARAHLGQALLLFEGVCPPHHPLLGRIQHHLGLAHEGLIEPDKAEASFAFAEACGITAATLHDPYEPQAHPCFWRASGAPSVSWRRV